MNNNKPLIVIVDDSHENLQFGREVLSKKYTVIAVSSAKRLFHVLENNTPAMILLDVDMPEMNGHEAIEILKSKPETRDIPVIFLTARAGSDDELVGLSMGAIDYITKPFRPPLLLKRIEVHLLVETQRKKLEKQAVELKNFNDNLQKMVEAKTESISSLHNAMLKTIAELVECRDDITGGHIERTQKGIKILLEAMIKSNVHSEETKDWNIDLLLKSCQLYDVGKLSINDSILKKPGKLDEEEFKNIKNHVSLGKQIIEKIEDQAKESDFLRYAKIFAAYHHEKWDGTGYPFGLKEEEIPLLGRIMAIADVYDALVSDRPYKTAYTHEEAVEIIRKESGTQFDPDLVEIFIQSAEQLKD
jgi:putative two-component system response regulator